MEDTEVVVSQIWLIEKGDLCTTSARLERRYAAVKADTPVYEYEPKTWGPAEVELVTPPGGWHSPIVNNGAAA